MYRVLIWGLGYKYNLYLNAIKYCEMQGEIKVVGITDKNMPYTCLDGYPFVPLERINTNEVDYIAVTSDDSFKEISVQAQRLGFAEKHIIFARIFCLPGFKFRKYIKLVSSDISIIANNCLGGGMLPYLRDEVSFAFY